MALHLSVEQYAEIKMTLPTLQKADRAMDDHLLPASQMWKNSCRIMYQVILLSNCYQTVIKTKKKCPKPLIFQGVWGNVIYSHSLT